MKLTAANLTYNNANFDISNIEHNTVEIKFTIATKLINDIKFIFRNMYKIVFKSCTIYRISKNLCIVDKADLSLRMPAIA